MRYHIEFTEAILTAPAADAYAMTFGGTIQATADRVAVIEILPEQAEDIDAELDADDEVCVYRTYSVEEEGHYDEKARLLGPVDSIPAVRDGRLVDLMDD